MKYIGLLLSVFSLGYAFPVGNIESAGYVSSSAILTPLSSLGETVDNVIGAITKSKTLTPGFPDSGRKMAVLGQKSLESLPIQLDDKYGNLQQFVANVVNPKPIVDTIEEHEKYGNDGDHFRKVATVLIGGVEGLSNVLNAAVELPFTTFRQVGRKITTSLNTVGGKLVGLA